MQICNKLSARNTERAEDPDFLKVNMNILTAVFYLIKKKMYPCVQLVLT